jgi:hypothetical protein
VTGFTSKDTTALQSTKRWAARNPQGLKSAFAAVREDPSYEHYVSSFVQDLPRFLKHHGWVINPDFIVAIAAALGTDLDDLKEMARALEDPRLAKEWSSREPDEDELKLPIDAFVVGNLLRGRYYDLAARRTEAQIAHHPIRQPILQPLQPAVAIEHTDSEMYLTHIIILGSLCERTDEARLSRWWENVKRVRLRIQDYGLVLPQVGNENGAVERAVLAAKEAGVVIHSKLVDRFFASATAAGITLGTGYGLAVWPDPVSTLVGVAVSAASAWTRQPGRIVGRMGHRFHSRASRLRTLARAGQHRGVL